MIVRSGVALWAALGAASAALAIDPAAAQSAIEPAEVRVPLDIARPESSSLAPGVPHAELTASNLEAWLDGFLPYALLRGDIAGAAVVVVKDGRILLEKGYGYADLEQRTPLDPQRHLIRAASISKLFTYTAVMQQVEQGKLDLDTDINRYLDFEIPATFEQPITMRHLMTHSAGFEERMKGVFTTDAQRYVPMAQHLRSEPVPDRIFPPGKITAYSNYSTTLLGHIIARTTGVAFEDYIERSIFEPLGMRSATFRQPLPQALAANLSKSYDIASSGEILPFEYMSLTPAGALSVTPNDMARFMIAHLQQGRLAEAQILRPETAALLHAHAFTPIESGPGMTLGFFEADRNGHRIIGHWGDHQGFHDDLELFLNDGVGFFTSLTSDGREGAAHSLRLSLFQQFADRYFDGEPLVDPPMAPTAQEHAKLIAGEYTVSRRTSGDFLEILELLQRFTVTANEDGTIVTPALASLRTFRPATWKEIAPFEWQQVGERARLAARLEGESVAYWFPAELPSIMVFERLPWWKTSVFNLPLLIASAAIFLSWMLHWPVSALVRWHYGASLNLGAGQAQADNYARYGVLVFLVFLLGWVGVVVAVSVTDFGTAVDPWVRIVQLVGVLNLAAAAAIVWNAWITCRGERCVWVKAWSVGLSLAALYVVWFSFAFHLMSVSQNY